MTDFLESVLSSMSSAFNSSPTPADGVSVIDLNLNEDKTLKWRSLLNNSNALKSNKKTILLGGNHNCGVLNGGCSEQQQQQQQEINSTEKNKMSQGQDNISNNEIINNTKCLNDKEKVNSDTISVNASSNKKNDNDDGDGGGNNSANQQNKVTTRRRKNLQNRISKKPLENSISASRRSRRSLPIEISKAETKRMATAVVAVEKIPKRRGRSKKLAEIEVRDTSPKKQQNLAKTSSNSEDTKSSPNKVNEQQLTTSQESNRNLQQSPNGRQYSPSGRKLRRSERNSIPDEIKVEETEMAVVLPPKQDETNNLEGDETMTEPKGKRTRRSERLESRYETEDSANKIHVIPVLQEPIEIKEESKKLPEVKISLTPSDGESEKKQQIQQSPSKTPVPTTTAVEVTPKRRGRRTKTVTPEKPTAAVEPNATPITAAAATANKKPRNTKENGDNVLSSTVIARKEKPIELPPVPAPAPISQRPLRRIKPTVKILENEELRYEFETKNIARMTACCDIVTAASTESPLVSSIPYDVEMSPINSSKVKKEQKEETTKEQTPKATSSSSASSSSASSSASTSKDSSPRLPPTLIPPSPPSTPASGEIKKKLFPPIENNLNVDNIYPASVYRPCPDPQTFLSEIKAAKINLHKSPENKKLNRKQHRKLLKQKEKHFEKLGLRKNVKDDRTETEDTSSDNEDFVPPKKLNVGKPNVTLRLRNKENSPVPTSSTKSQQKTQKKRINSRLSSSSGGGGGRKLSVAATIAATATETLPPGPPSSSLHKEIKKEQPMICLCQKSSQYYTRNTPETAFCCAIDSIEDEKVGCCNQLNGELLNLLRPSHRVGYMILCDDHKKRLLAHNCCASCGIFCTQGKFILCKQEHFFHAACAQKYILNTPYDPTNQHTTYPSPILVLKCPHCGCDTPEKTSLVTMKCNSLPIFLPSQRVLIKPAKMSVPEGEMLGRTRRRFPSVIEMDKLIPESVMNIASQRQVVGSNTNAVATAIDGGSEFTSKDMFYAINNDDLERVAEIIASCYDITTKMPEFLNGTCLHLVAHFGTVQMAYLLLCRESSEYFLNMIDKELRTPAMCAVIGDKCDILKLFIQFGADLSLKGSDGMTCLHMAAKLGSIAAAQLIVESFKNSTSIMNFKKFINAQDDGGWTAMVWAAENGYTDIVSYLISHGADPNVCDTENNTVLHWATLSNRIETIMVLLQANINCNQQNINGDTPLHIACRQSSTRICLMLIANGADLMIKNKANELPYDCIPNEESQCARAVGFNMQMRSFGSTGLRNKVVCSDISNGRETHPIQAVRAERLMKSRNDQDDDIILPDFKYITKSILLQNSIQIDQRVSQMRICSCNDGCNTDDCQCSTISVQNWYTPEGRLNSEFCFDDPPMIFECNDVCGCNKLVCKNRVVQNGIKIPLQVFECEQRLKGWGVRSLIQIPRGTFISEYTGEILTDLEADRRTDDSYFFDLGASDHCIDANYYGNISRFYNHSCSPNIVPVRVYYEHQDYRFPKIAFFACKDIMAGEELSFDYGDKFWGVKQKYFSCQCKSGNCRYNATNTNEISSMITNISSNVIPVTG